VSSSKSNFVPAGDDIEVFVEHGDFDDQTFTFIHGIGREMWNEPVGKKGDPSIREGYPTLRFWKSRKPVPKPDLHLTKGRFRFVPPTSKCLLGEETKYDEHGRIATHPACKCDRCTHYSYYQWNRSEWTQSQKFWNKITKPVEIEV
jgi:hypothetical protein